MAQSAIMSSVANVHFSAHEQKLLYATIFKLHFGISEEMASFLDDFCQAMTDVTLPEPVS